MRESFRVWMENLETFVLEVIFEERRGAPAVFVRALLFGGSKVFKVLVKARRFLYNARILRDSTLGVQVIAIGNLTVGGTGKTPVVEKFARELRDQGRNVAILSRGYRSKPRPFHEWALNKILFREDTTPPRIVSDGKSLLLDSEMAGDEPYMLASNLKDVVVLVDKDRVKSGRFAIEKYGCDTLLLDDGFQYWDLRGRRHDVVLVDRQQPFGNEHLLAGALPTQVMVTPVGGGSPVPATDAPVQAVVVSTPNADGNVIHEVKYGQTLWQIAISYVTRIDEIKRLNFIRE